MKKLLSIFAGILLFLALIPVAEARTVLILRPVPFLGEQTRPVSNFSGVAASGSFNVIIRIGTAESLRLEGDNELLDKIETVVENGTLKIRTKKSFENRRLKFNKVKIYVTAKKLNAVALSGSGNMRVMDAVNAEVFSASVSGSGNLETAAISAGKLIAVVSGSGNISTAGDAKEVQVVVSGSGGLDGKKFTANVANVQIDGSGNVFLGASETLNGNLSGSGKIYYSGKAKVTERKNGSGEIVRM